MTDRKWCDVCKDWVYADQVESDCMSLDCPETKEAAASPKDTTAK